MFHSIHSLLVQHKDALESFAIFYGWLLKIWGFASLPIILIIFLLGNSLFAVTLLAAAVGLIVVGTVVTREYQWSGAALSSLVIAVGLAMLLVPYGVDLVYVFLLQLAVSVAAFIACGNINQISLRQGIFSFLLTLIFINFVAAHAQPQLYGVDPESGSVALEEQFAALSEAEPVELLESDEMKEQIIDMYNLSLFSTDKEIITAIEKNPQPLRDLQNSLPYSYALIENSLLGYVASIYISLISN
jgi:hypothetical protein